MYIRLVIQLEVLMVNLMFTYLIARKKYNISKVVFFLCLYTLTVFTIAFFIRDAIPKDILIIVLGTSYIFPLTILFNETPQKMASIMFFVWMQTMFITKLSHTIVFTLFEANNILLLVISTTLLILFIPFITLFIKGIFNVIMDNTTEKSFIFLFVTTTSLFTMAVIISFFTEDTWFHLLALFLVEIISVSVYVLLKEFVKESKLVKDLNKIAFTDSLTQLDNRFSLFSSVKKMIEEHVDFHCIYMDLDDFKGVNDSYGHAVGDLYLKAFAASIQKSITPLCHLYRLAGDEFIIISRKKEFDLAELQEHILRNFSFDYPFRGVSIGISTFKKDGDTLDKLLIASDSKMYKGKHNRNFRLSNR